MLLPLWLLHPRSAQVAIRLAGQGSWNRTAEIRQLGRTITAEQPCQGYLGLDNWHRTAKTDWAGQVGLTGIICILDRTERTGRPGHDNDQKMYFCEISDFRKKSLSKNK